MRGRVSLVREPARAEGEGWGFKCRISSVVRGVSTVGGLTAIRLVQVRSLPIRKDDEVQIVRGKHAKEAVAKVTSVYRRRYCIHVDRIIKEKTNGAQVQVPIHPSKVQITKLKLDKDRKALIERKKAGRSVGGDKGKGKFSEKDVAMADVD